MGFSPQIICTSCNLKLVESAISLIVWNGEEVSAISIHHQHSKVVIHCGWEWEHHPLVVVFVSSRGGPLFSRLTGIFHQRHAVVAVPWSLSLLPTTLFKLLDGQGRGALSEVQPVFAPPTTKSTRSSDRIAAQRAAGPQHPHQLKAAAIRHTGNRRSLMTYKRNYSRARLPEIWNSLGHETLQQ